MSEAECPNGKIRCNSKSITTCYSPGEEDTCPITDVKLVKKEGFSLTNYPGYVLATAPEALQWYLLYSRTSEHLPVSGFQLTEERPCSLTNAWQVTTTVVDENIIDDDIGPITNDPFVFFQCPLQPLESIIEQTYRSASTEVTVNEAELLD